VTFFRTRATAAGGRGLGSLAVELAVDVMPMLSGMDA
jgi:hypothetical protein